MYDKNNKFKNCISKNIIYLPDYTRYSDNVLFV